MIYNLELKQKGKLMKTIEIKIEDSSIDTVMNILQSLKKDIIQKISIKETHDNDNTPKRDFSEFAGMWRDREIDIETIRDKAWKQSS